MRRLPADSVEAIFAKSSGQARTEELFLRAQLTAITTADLSAVTMQSDGVKRVREARRRLARRGVLVGRRRFSRRRADHRSRPARPPTSHVDERPARPCANTGRRQPHDLARRHLVARSSPGRPGDPPPRVRPHLTGTAGPEHIAHARAGK
ncbi:NaeI family type II restriction endonuclease [Streptomyces sp. ALI-76-A]|uniref:NaeI family type II restriction endonuclease n=1 Tax=Streptomyces sp. ALI-76-A TaxID=3025736 RepID=UPI0033650425